MAKINIKDLTPEQKERLLEVLKRREATKASQEPKKLKRKGLQVNYYNGSATRPPSGHKV